MWYVAPTASEWGERNLTGFSHLLGNAPLWPSCMKKTPLAAKEPCSLGHFWRTSSQGKEPYVLERRWRASETCCCGCPRPPTCGLPPDLCAASHRSPRCCRTWPSSPPPSCSHRTRPRSSFCIHLNSASHSPRNVSKSVKQRQNNLFLSQIQSKARSSFFLSSLTRQPWLQSTPLFPRVGHRQQTRAKQIIFNTSFQVLVCY